MFIDEVVQKVFSSITGEPVKAISRIARVAVNDAMCVDIRRLVQRVCCVAFT